MNCIASNLQQLDRVVELKGAGCSLLDLLVQENVLLYTPCGGKGICGKCKVKVTGDVSDISSDELRLLTCEEQAKGIRLACKTFITGQATVYLSGDRVVNHSKEKIQASDQYPVQSSVAKLLIQVEEPSIEDDLSVVECVRGTVGDVDIQLDVLRKISNMKLYGNKITLILCDDQLIDIECGDTRHTKFGAAIDIGTTTVACYLMDLTRGKQVCVESMQNPQAAYGADVISRIHYCLQNDDGVHVLSAKIKEGINELLRKACRRAHVKEKDIYETVLVGNATMHHLFWGLNPVSLSGVPFNPVTRDMMVDDAGKAGISGMNTSGKVVFLPGIGGFLGSDTLGAVIASDVKSSKDNVLIIDLGTNGEIVLSSQGQMYACSTAAGPAFEGASIEYGMQAFSGAINSVFIDDDLHFTTIENAPAKGICGSGLIDIVSQLLIAGLVSENGRIADPEHIDTHCLSKRICKKNRRKRIALAYEDESQNGEIIYISQKDIRELQLAKGAIRAGINILLKVAHVKFEEIDRIFLAGAFGNFVNKESARKIGIFPDIDLEKVISLGNAAGEGAKLALCDKDILQKDIKENVFSIQHVAVSSHQDFQDEFVNGMCFR